MRTPAPDAIFVATIITSWDPPQRVDCGRLYMRLGAVRGSHHVRDNAILVDVNRGDARVVPIPDDALPAALMCFRQDPGHMVGIGRDILYAEWKAARDYLRTQETDHERNTG